MTPEERDQQLAKAARGFRSAERWATAGMWLSGCALALYAVAGLLVLAAVVLVVLVALAAR